MPTKKQSTKLSEKNQTVFQTSSEIVTDIPSENTTIVTSTDLAEKWLETSMYNYESKKNMYSSYLNDTTVGMSKLTNEQLDDLGSNPQSNLQKILTINQLSRNAINKNFLVGKVYETLESNINTAIELEFKNVVGQRNKKKIQEKAKELIEDFNEKINLDNLIANVVPMTFSEGTYIMYLRKDSVNLSYNVSYYPLGVAEVADYEVDGEPYVIINVKELTSRLQKINKKNKNGTPLFFKNIDEEIQSNYPTEVYEAYKNKELYAKLSIENSGVIRINNMNRKYGLTPIFRTVKPSLMLETFELSDEKNTKARGKKIIFQKLRVELLGEKGTLKPFSEMTYAHESLMDAWKNDIVLYTGMPWVEDLLYIEPKIEPTNVELVISYMNKIMTALGIGFLNAEKGAYASAQISINELLKLINKITTQLEKILKKWYKGILLDNNIPIEYTPNIKILDSEALSTEIKLKLAEFLFNKLNCSYQTAFDIVGYTNYESEKSKRISEKEDNAEEIFAPRLNAYTNSGKDSGNSGGRPTGGNNPDKTVEDKNSRDENNV